MSSNTREDRSGIALIMGIIVMAICLVITAGLMQYVISDYQATHLDWRRVQALYCAEAGVEIATEALRRNPSVRGVAETPISRFVAPIQGLSDAEGSCEVSIAAVPNDPRGALRITSTGYLPTKQNVDVWRTVVAVYTSAPIDFGMDAVRARQGIEYGGNENLTVVVDDGNNVIPSSSVNASMRVTGVGAAIGPVTSVASNKAHVAGDVTAPGIVDIIDDGQHARNINDNDPNNFIPNAFPAPDVLGAWDAGGNLVWPPTPGTWADMYYREALAGGTLYSPSGTIAAPKYIELGGLDELADVTITGPGVVFVHGNLGGNVTNGTPPATLVISGNVDVGGGDYYQFNPGGETVQPPSLMVFGPHVELRGNGEWHLNGPLLALNPQSEVWLSDSAEECVGAIISNGWVKFKSNKAVVRYPQRLQNQRFTAWGAPSVISYSAQ